DRAKLEFFLAELRSGDTTALQRIVAVTNDNEQTQDTRRTSFVILGLAYTHLSAPERAVKAFSNALEYADTDEHRSGVTGYLARAMADQGDTEQALHQLTAALASDADDTHWAWLYECMAVIFHAL